jgi:hypothetical protein
MKAKSISIIAILLVLSLLLAACGAQDASQVISQAPVALAQSADETPAPGLPAAGTSSDSILSEFLNTEYPDAINVRNQLAFGALRLDGSDNAITPQQARQLLPLWQAIVALSGTSTSNELELSAVQNQIAEAMSEAQLQSIAGMQLTNAQLGEYYAQHGIFMPTPEPGETRVPGQGKGKNLSEEARQATRTAKEASGETTGSGGGSNSGQAARTFLFEQVIALLQERAAQ